MSEYVIHVEDAKTLYVNTDIPFPLDAYLREKIVRCRDCNHYYEAENYHPSGNCVMRCCKYFDTYNDEVEPDGFCAWGERRDA